MITIVLHGSFECVHLNISFKVPTYSKLAYKTFSNSASNCMISRSSGGIICNCKTAAIPVAGSIK